MPILRLNALTSTFTTENHTSTDTFSSIRNAVQGNTFLTNPLTIESSQNPASTFTINRTGIPFPAIVPHGVRVNSAILRIFVNTILNTVDNCQIYVVQGSYTLPAGKPAYSAISFTKLGQVSFENLFQEQYNDIVISPPLNYYGIIKPYLITDLDFNNTSPGSGNVNKVEIEDGSSANSPQLILDVAYLKRAPSNSLMMTGKGI